MEAQEATADPLQLLQGLYPSARPAELSHLASVLAGKQLLPHDLKAKLVDAVVENVFMGKELRHRRWSKVSSLTDTPHRSCQSVCCTLPCVLCLSICVLQLVRCHVIAMT